MMRYFSINCSWVSGALWVEGNTVHRAHLLALRLVEVADALGAQIGVDHVNLLTGRDRVIRAFRFADVAVNAFVGDHQGHGHTSRMAYHPSSEIPECFTQQLSIAR
ncbi:hypothetical protein DK37_24595 [Halomonas sp. SUBG004]|nr:hypothetical protein DK37_24595 [Halomonas sp. SUBG004]